MRTLLLLLVLAIFSLSSCRATKEVAKETFVESLADPRSGAQVFVRKYDTEAYSINAAGMIKGRKEAERERPRRCWRTISPEAFPLR